MIEDTRQPEFNDYSKCDKCGAIFDNSDLNELRGNRWYCDYCKAVVGSEEKQEWGKVKYFIREVETKIESVNDTYYTLNDDELNNLCDLLERAWGIVNKLT